MKSREWIDDHIWLTYRGEGWAIRSIDRLPHKTIFRLWRGYEPNIEHGALAIPSDHDWKPYCREAVRLLENEYGKLQAF